VVLGVGGYYLYTSQTFERNAPKIEIADEIFWSLKQPLKLVLEDDTGIKEYKVIMSDGKSKETVDLAKLANPQKRIELSIKPPAGLELEGDRALLEIEVRDKSLWNYFLGNSAKKLVHIHIDRKKPDLYIVTNSYGIRKGGSALVIFHCQDKNLKEFFIKTNFGKKFQAQPFFKDGYYIALIAWPITQERFRADIVAYDKAGNRSKAYIPLYLKQKRYRISKITLKDSFLQGKIETLAQEYPETANMTPIQKFKFVNETLRERNEKLIHELASKVSQARIDDFPITPFYPLKNAAVVASFGDHRYYYYKGKLVSESYHMGLDLASVRQAPVKLGNDGEVVYADFNGIYGNMPLIDHGLGLYTLYAHCSTLYVKKGDEVAKGETIAKTGSTGLALGDHLHFGVLVQGIEVRPEEWMDRKWIKDNVTQVIKDAKKIIDSK